MATNTTVRNLARLSNVSISIDYDLVFDAKAIVQTGVGITSATPTSQEIIDGDSCTFTATVETDWKFDGWYTSSDFSGTPESTINPYIKNNITNNVTLYPKAIPSYRINVFGNTDRFTYTLSKTKAYPGDTVTLTVTPTKTIYKFSSIYEADANGNKTSIHLSNNNPYTFTMPNEEVYLYVEVGKEVKIYVSLLNCSLSDTTSPITSSGGKTETLRFTYNNSSSDWSGIYSDSNYTNRLSSTTEYTFQVPENDLYLYAKAIPKQQIYIKENGSWVAYSEVYVKENGVWVKKDDFMNIFDTLKNYKKIDL